MCEALGRQSASGEGPLINLSGEATVRVTGHQENHCARHQGTLPGQRTRGRRQAAQWRCLTVKGGVGRRLPLRGWGAVPGLTGAPRGGG